MPKKSYMKASRRRDGYIEKPFEKLTDEIISIYSEESRAEAEKIGPIRKSAPHLFEVDDELSMWKSIYDDLSLLDVSNDLSKIYDYKGGRFTLRFYLEARGGVEDNALMVVVAYALNVALAKTYCLFHKDMNGLARVVDFAYYSGKTTCLAAFQREVVAGKSRTGEATEEVIELKNQRVDIAIIAAKKLKVENPSIKKKAISKLICKEVGVSDTTVLGYLKGVNLSE